MASKKTVTLDNLAALGFLGTFCNSCLGGIKRLPSFGKRFATANLNRSGRLRVTHRKKERGGQSFIPERTSC